MVSLTYAVFRGLIGLFLIGLVYTLLDEVKLIFHNFAIQEQLSGNMLFWMDWFWTFTLVSICCAFLLGGLVKSYIERNIG